MVFTHNNVTRIRFTNSILTFRSLLFWPISSRLKNSAEVYPACRKRRLKGLWPTGSLGLFPNYREVFVCQNISLVDAPNNEIGTAGRRNAIAPTLPFVGQWVGSGRTLAWCSLPITAGHRVGRVGIRGGCRLDFTMWFTRLNAWPGRSFHWREISWAPSRLIGEVQSSKVCPEHKSGSREIAVSTP